MIPKIGKDHITGRNWIRNLLSWIINGWVGNIPTLDIGEGEGGGRAATNRTEDLCLVKWRIIKFNHKTYL